MRELIGLGDLSSIGPKIGSKHGFRDCPIDECNAYGRDRGEQETEARRHWNREMFKYEESHEDRYSYLYSVKESKWLFRYTRRWPLEELTLLACDSK